MKAWSSLLASFSDLVFPESCPGCDRTISSEDGPWCVDCALALAPTMLSDYCPRCGLTVGPHLRDPAGCGLCREQSSPLEGFVRVGEYTGLLKDVVQKYKFQRQQRLDRILGGLLADRITEQPWSEDLHALVPVPATWSSRIEYRCAPAHLLAVVVGRRLGLPVLPLLEVHGKRQRQVQLPLSERAANVRGVFRLGRSARPQGHTICLIDDVSTTGATLREAGRVLKKARAEYVYAAVVAKTNPW